jgi:dTDP-4-dehydrorhamnose 3,5-epimerase
MEKIATSIQGAWALKPRVARDARGYFFESWNQRSFREAGLDANFVQDNYSHSSKHVLRGLHYQAGAAAQGKLVWVTAGRVFDVIVDLRRTSPTFGRWHGCILGAEAHESLWIPPGCAHGFLVLSDYCDFQYKATNLYSPEAERTLRWNDPHLAIEWPLGTGAEPIVSPKDAASASFAECEKYD